MAIGWHVTSQAERTKQLPTGGFQNVVVVTFMTDAGTQGSVEVPKATFTADNVKAAIDNYVAHIGAVEGLSG